VELRAPCAALPKLGEQRPEEQACPSLAPHACRAGLDGPTLEGQAPHRVTAHPLSKLEMGQGPGRRSSVSDLGSFRLAGAHAGAREGHCQASANSLKSREAGVLPHCRGRSPSRERAQACFALARWPFQKSKGRSLSSGKPGGRHPGLQLLRLSGAVTWVQEQARELRPRVPSQSHTLCHVQVSCWMSTTNCNPALEPAEDHGTRWDPAQNNGMNLIYLKLYLSPFSN
jgi:hypothetical protein